MDELQLIKQDQTQLSTMVGSLRVLSDYIRETHFKRLMNQVMRMQVDQNLKSLAVLSQYPQEGRSFFVASMAIAYAKFLDSNVLILDTTDQTRRRSVFLESIHQEGEQRDDGSFALNRGSIDIMTTKSREMGELDCADFQLKRFIKEVSPRYDLVIVDTCALSTAARENIDPLIAGRSVEASILLTSPRSHSREVVEFVKSECERFDVRLLGVAYNEGGRR